jgi:hypothetical protein
MKLTIPSLGEVALSTQTIVAPEQRPRWPSQCYRGRHIVAGLTFIIRVLVLVVPKKKRAQSRFELETCHIRDFTTLG